MSDEMNMKIKESVIRRQKNVIDCLTEKNLTLQEENLQLKRKVQQLVNTIDELAELSGDASRNAYHILEKL